MTLVDVQLELQAALLSSDVQSLIAEAQAEIDQFVEARRDEPIVAFVPSNFGLVHSALVDIRRLSLATGHRFAEWGSGFGVVTCLAAQLGFDAVGIEIEPELVDASRRLAATHGIDAEFVCGSFVPTGAERLADQHGDVAWLRTDGTAAYDTMDLEPDDFDVIFAYPWPGEEQVLFDIFERYACRGALLLTFHGQDGVRLQRKVLR